MWDFAVILLAECKTTWNCLGFTYILFKHFVSSLRDWINTFLTIGMDIADSSFTLYLPVFSKI